VPHLLQQLGVAFTLEGGFELVVGGKVGLERTFAGRGYDDDLLYATGYRFLYCVLDHGFICQRQELFGDGLGCRQEPGAPAGRGYNRLANLLSCHCLNILHEAVSMGKLWSLGIFGKLDNEPCVV